MSAFKGYRTVILEAWWLGKRGGNPRLASWTHSSRPFPIIGKRVVRSPLKESRVCWGCVDAEKVQCGS